MCECIVVLSSIFFLSLLCTLPLSYTMSSNLSVIFYVCEYTICLCVGASMLGRRRLPIYQKRFAPPDTPCQKSIETCTYTHIFLCVCKREGPFKIVLPWTWLESPVMSQKLLVKAVLFLQLNNIPPNCSIFLNPRAKG